MNDQRLDGLIRAALTTEADRLAAAQPTLTGTVHELGQRVRARDAQGPWATARSRLAISGATRPVRLLWIVLLLSAIVATTIVGARLLEQRHVVPVPGPFGFSAPCVDEPTTPGSLVSAHSWTSGGELMELTVDASGAAFRLIEGSRLIAGLDSLPERPNAVAVQRRLSPEGVSLIAQRLEDAGLQPGCREFGTAALGGRITAALPDGPVQITWSPFPDPEGVSVTASTDNERQAAALIADLVRPETWLPESAWLDPQERPVVPERWVLVTRFSQTNFAPGADVRLRNGDVLIGSDPRYRLLALPGGADLASFGTEILLDGAPVTVSPWTTIGDAPITSQRCGSLTQAEVDALRASIEGVRFGTDRSEALFTEDLSQRIGLTFLAEFPAGSGCEAQAESLRQWARERDLLFDPSPPPTPSGELAAMSPCAFVSARVLDILGANIATTVASTLPVGTHARACHVGWRLTLYPWRVDAAGAERLVEGILGVADSQNSAAADPVWFNDCMTLELPCLGLVAIYLEPYFLVLEVPNPQISTRADEVIAAIVAGPRP